MAWPNLEIKVDPRQFVVLPNPVHELSLCAAAHDDAPQQHRVGVIGHYSRYKNMDELVALLRDARRQRRLSARIVVGCDDAKALSDWREPGLETIDTKEYSDYLRALARCDVVVLNYPREQYYFRSSGVISDAASLGVAVVCPDFPILRKQVTEPARIGAVFRTEQEILPAIAEALTIRRNMPENFATWAQSRHARDFSQRLDAFVAGRSRGGC